jgi:hypothetical protein
VIALNGQSLMSLSSFNEIDFEGGVWPYGWWQNWWMTKQH